MTARHSAQLVIGTEREPRTGGLKVRCVGAWTVDGIAPLERQLEVLSWPDERELVIDGSAMSALDTSGAWLLQRTVRALEQQGRRVRIQGLRPEFHSLLQLIASHEVTAQAGPAPAPSLLATVGERAWSISS